MPPKAVLLAHPNTMRVSVWYMNYVNACFSRDNPRLEQGATGTSAFSFADGHVARLSAGLSSGGKHQAGDAEDPKYYRQDIYFTSDDPCPNGNWFGDSWAKAIW